MENYKWKILMADDERLNLEILSHILNPNYLSGTNDNSDYILSVAKSGRAALDKAMNDKPDLILLDIIMPDMNGFEVLTALKQSDITRNIPVIFITGLDSIDDEEKGFALGAVDYITKPFHSSLVKARIKTHLRIVEQMRMIEQIGLVDVLTSIPNRRAFDCRITVEWSRAVRERTSIGLLMLDIDRFKLLNDTYGHQQGDIALQLAANIIASSLQRTTDFAARWGGEEFVVLMPGTDLCGALAVAENIRSSIESASVPAINSRHSLNITISIGAVAVIPNKDTLIPDFISDADKALYTAKETGRNRVCS